jgi:hypothetical protein
LRGINSKYKLKLVISLLLAIAVPIEFVSVKKLVFTGVIEYVEGVVPL